MPMLRFVALIYLFTICVMKNEAAITFEGQYVDLLFGHINQSAVESRAQRVIQLIDQTHAVLSGTDDGKTWWGNILGYISNNGLTMHVDFSPKGGPSSVEANLTNDGQIIWTGNNVWERTSFAASFSGTYSSLISGPKLPKFRIQFQTVEIQVKPFSPPNYHTTVATITSSAWGPKVTVTGVIQFNVLNVNFESVGGPSNIRANLTSSGDIQWLEGENLWSRSLCSTTYSTSSNSSEIFTQGKVLSIISFVVMLICIMATLGYAAYAVIFKRKTKSYGSRVNAKMSKDLLANLN